MNEIISNIAVFALPVLFALTFRVSAHAFAANYLGDKTAYMQGRVSFNPAKHIDLLGSIILPIASFAVAGASGIPFIFGYAKPVPIDFEKLPNPKQGMAIIFGAGLAANYAMALLWNVLLIVLHAAKVNEPFFIEMANAGVFTNLIIFTLNLLPLPPLDGGRVLIGLLPHEYAVKVAKIEPYGFFVIMILVLSGDVLFKFWIVPVMGVFNFIMQLILYPLNFLLN
jgi:Zn-dependent protease